MGTSLMQRAKAAVTMPGQKSPALIRAEADYAALRRVVPDEDASPTMRYLKQRIQSLKARAPQGD